MTELTFHFNVSHKLLYVCRLLRKAVNANARVLLVASAEDLQRLDVELWTFSDTEFISHVWGHDGGVACQRAQVVFSQISLPALEHTDVLVNLASVVPENFVQFSRLIEVVGEDAAERDAARLRWKFYAQLGYAVRQHDAARIV